MEQRVECGEPRVLVIFECVECKKLYLVFEDTGEVESAACECEDRAERAGRLVGQMVLIPEVEA